jgi:hypothetical protein
MVDNIIWHNRMFYWQLEDTDPDNILSGLCPDIGSSVGLTCTGGNAPVYNDLAVIGVAGTLTCTDCIETGAGNPLFIAEYVNAGRNTTTTLPEGTISAPPALDEGGNFIRLRYGPLTQVDSTTGDLLGDYHVESGSPAVDAGSNAGVNTDFDGESRPVDGPDQGGQPGYDIGADEVHQ